MMQPAGDEHKWKGAVSNHTGTSLTPINSKEMWRIDHRGKFRCSDVAYEVKPESIMIGRSIDLNFHGQRGSR